MEIVTAARRYLLQEPAVTSMVQQRVWKYRLEEPVDGTGAAALVLSRQPGWGGRDPVMTLEYPRLFVDAHIDPTRDLAGNITVRNGEDRGYQIARIVQELFRYPKLWGERMGSFGSRLGLMVVSAQPYAEPRPIDGADLGLKNTDVVIIRTEIALVTVDG